MAVTFTLFAFATIPVSNAAALLEPTPVPAGTEMDPAVAKAAEEFNSLSKREKKSRLKEAKKLFKKLKANKDAGMQDDAETNTILLAILAILLPPLAIYLKERAFTWKFWVSLILIIPVFFVGWYFWFAAVLLALLVVFNVL